MYFCSLLSEGHDLLCYEVFPMLPWGREQICLHSRFGNGILGKTPKPEVESKQINR